MAKDSKPQAERAPIPEHLLEYRKHLVAAEQKSQEDFDKTVLSLSGGALGVSFVFLKDVIGPRPIESPSLLTSAWVAWGTSTICVLASYFMSHLALRRAIRQVDEGTIYQQRAGGTYRFATAALNGSGAVLFFVGVISITLFARANLTAAGRTDGNSPTTATSTSSTTATTTRATGGQPTAPTAGLHSSGPTSSPAK